MSLLLLNKNNKSKRDDLINSTAFVIQEATKGKNNKIVSCKISTFFELDEKRIWLLDSGASRHLCCQKEWFTELLPCNEFVYLGDDRNLKVEGRGKILISKLVNNKWLDGEINDVSYVPCLKKNLFSTGICTSKDFSIDLHGDYADKHKQIVVHAIKQNINLIRLLIKPRIKTTANYASSAPLKTWHKRLSHVVTCSRK